VLRHCPSERRAGRQTFPDQGDAPAWRPPEKSTIDGSETHAPAIRSYNKTHGTAIVIRQVKYLNNIAEQDHRIVTRVTRPMLGFKSFDTA